MSDFETRLRNAYELRQGENGPEGKALAGYLQRNENSLVAAALADPFQNKGFLESYAAGNSARARELGLYPGEVRPPTMTLDAENRLSLEPAPLPAPSQGAQDFRQLIAAENVPGWGRVMLQVPGGVYDAVQEMGLTMMEFEKAISGMTDLEQLDPALALALKERGLPDPSDPEVMRSLKFKIAPSKNMAEGVTRGISTFLAGMLPAAAGFRALGLGHMAAASLGGAVADLGAFRGLDGNLSTLANEMGFGNDLTAYLDATKNSTELEAKLANAVEGLVLGTFIDITGSGIKGAVRGRVTAQQARSFAAAVVGAAKGVKLMRRLDEGLSAITMPGSPKAQRGAITLGGSLADTPAAPRPLDVRPEVAKQLDTHGITMTVADDTDGALRFRANLEDGPHGQVIAWPMHDGTLRIFNTTLDPKMRGQGIGVLMYQAVIDEAQRRGLRVVSDEVVSREAVRVYESLVKQGYRVKRAEGLIDAEGDLTNPTGAPVFTIEPQKGKGKKGK